MDKTIYKKSPKKAQKRRFKPFILFLTLFAALNLFLLIFLLERFGMPTAEQMIREYAVTEINSAISETLEEVYTERNITAGDLYTPAFNSEGRLTYLEVNPVPINSLCAATAQRLSQRLNIMPQSSIRLPLGILTGIGFLSSSGPALTFRLTPSGSATADYETALESAGIGQVSFKVWLVVNTEVGIVNPLLSRRLKVTRKLMLINTVFSGEVPQGFYGEREK